MLEAQCIRDLQTRIQFADIIQQFFTYHSEKQGDLYLIIIDSHTIVHLVTNFDIRVLTLQIYSLSIVQETCSTVSRLHYTFLVLQRNNDTVRENQTLIPIKSIIRSLSSINHELVQRANSTKKKTTDSLA